MIKTVHFINLVENFNCAKKQYVLIRYWSIFDNIIYWIIDSSSQKTQRNQQFWLLYCGPEIIPNRSQIGKEWMDVAQTGLDLNPEIRGSIVHCLLSAPSSAVIVYKWNPYQKNQATPYSRASKPRQSVHTSLTPTPPHPLLLTPVLRFCRFTR